MLKRVDDLLTQARFCLSEEDAKVQGAAESVISFLVLHLKKPVVTIPPDLVRHVRKVEAFCKEK